MSDYESFETSGDKLYTAYNEDLIYLKNENLQICYNLIFTANYLFMGNNIIAGELIKTIINKIFIFKIYYY